MIFTVAYIGKLVMYEEKESNLTDIENNFLLNIN